MASWAVAYRVTSAPVGLLIGDVAPLRAQPTMLETECVYILSLNSLVMDLTTLITESSYWPRNVGGTLSVFSHAGVAASRNKQKFLFFELSSLFIMRGGGGGNSGRHEKSCWLVLPRLLLSPGILQLKSSLQHLGDITEEHVQSFEIVCKNSPFNETWWGRFLYLSC